MGKIVGCPLCRTPVSVESGEFGPVSCPSCGANFPLEDATEPDYSKQVLAPAAKNPTQTVDPWGAPQSAAPVLRTDVEDDPYRPPREASYRSHSDTEKGEMPAWVWLFVVACGAIPVVALGGAIPAAIGFGAAGGCMSVSRMTSLPPTGRVLICFGITVAAWVGFVFMLIVLFGLQKP